MKTWQVTYKDSHGKDRTGKVYGETEAKARTWFAINFSGCTIVSVKAQ